jgi:hypothetical protein
MILSAKADEITKMLKLEETPSAFQVSPHPFLSLFFRPPHNKEKPDSLFLFRFELEDQKV